MTDNLIKLLLKTQEKLKMHIEKNRRKHIPRHIINSVKDEIDFLEEAINIEKSIIENDDYIKKYGRYTEKSEIDYVNSCIQYTINMQRSISEGLSDTNKPQPEIIVDISERQFDKEFLLIVKRTIERYNERGDTEIVNKIIKYYLSHFEKHNIEINI